MVETPDVFNYLSSLKKALVCWGAIIETTFDLINQQFLEKL